MLSEEVLDALVARLYLPIYKFCLQYVREEDAAKELTQETFLTLVEKAPRLTDDSLDAWLYATAHRKIQNYFKKNKRHPAVSLDAMDEQLADRLLLKLESRCFGDCFDVYHKALIRHLSKSEAQLYWEIFRLGKTPEALAEELGVRPGTLRTRITRLKKKVIRIIEEDLPVPEK